MAECRSCGAKIEWVTTPKGKFMPVDPEYYNYTDLENGDVIVTDQGNAYRKTPEKNYSSVKGRMSHFSSCPNAKEHRRR